MDLNTFFAKAAAEKYASIFKVLSVGTRLRIINLLQQRQYCVNALSRELGVTAAATSQHLRVLRDAGLVMGDKKGMHVHYRVDNKALKIWLAAIQGFFEEGAKG
jgi:DNA-binding transcriptional ArsR family regulator